MVIKNARNVMADVDLDDLKAVFKGLQDGKLTAPIKDINIMGNGPKMLRNVTMVANDLEMARSAMGYCGKDGQTVPVGLGLPTTLVKSMTVGGVKA